MAEFCQGDATALPFPEDRFDVAVMALVIFFVPDPADGIAEMVRVVCRGGMVATYAWDMLGGGFPLEPIQAGMRENARVDGQKPGTRRERRTSGPLTAKSISIKDAKRRPGDCARKAAELTPGDLLCVAAATEYAARHSDRRAEVSRGRSRSCRRQG